MCKKVDKKVEVKVSKRIIAMIMMISYIFVISPIALFAEESKKVMQKLKTVSVEEEKSEVLISAEEGGIVTLGDASIEIPAGALKKDTNISITRLYKVEDTGESLYNAIPKAGGYRFLPAGTKFEKEVIITLPYSAELNAKPQSLDELYTYFYDTQKKSWIKLERLEVDKEHNKVRSLSTHFTDMINATLTMPESASPVDVNLNSIKNLEAAKPDSHLIKFNPPKASNMGDASFSFELAVPAGRKGMQPQISVSYSSGGGNGIMGSNFDLNYGSCITTDTRFGLPKYDTNDTYMLDGILLSEKSRTETTITYQPKREAAFSRIIRFLDDNHWEVTDKSGTKRIYEQNVKSCVGNGNETFTWNLTKIIDFHKNTVIYEYNDFEEDTFGYVYPTSIYYTGYDDAKGKYSVKFNYDENGVKRQDVRIDGRSKKIVVCKKLLTSITTHYNDGDPIRKYTFTYKEGLAKENLLVSLTVSNNADESYTYTFDYNDPETDSNGNVIYFADTQEWYMGKDNPLQITNSTSIGKNYNASAGVGYGTKCIDGRITGGVSGSSGEGETYSEDSIVDINGDGRPDAISQVGNQVYVALNNGKGFDPKQPVLLKSGKLESDLDYEKNTNSSVGWNIYGGIGKKGDKISVTAGAGYSEVYQKSSSKVLCTFIDMNRDGLADIIESGKEYYLKNEGNLCFSKAYIASSVMVNDVVQPMSRKDRNDYQKTYYVQNPFRMWKAPYEGVVTITETVNGINVKKNVTAKTFIGSESSDKELEIVKTDNGAQSKTKSDYLIEKDKNIYFVTDAGDEPKGTDIDWNIDIKFTEIKTLKNTYPVPVIVPELVQNGGSVLSVKNEPTIYPHTLNKLKEEFEKDFKDKLSDVRLMDLFSISEEEIKNEQGYVDEYRTNILYSDDWKKDKNKASELYQVIIDNGYFIPGVITEGDFEKYINELVTNESITKSETYFKTFAAQFTHCVAEKVFVLKPFSSDAERKQFFRDYPLSTELKQSCLKNYGIDGIKTYYSDSDIKYTGSKTYEIPENTKRSENNTGSVFKKNEKVYYKIGDFGGVNKPLYFNATDEKIICDYDALSEAGIKDYVYDEENNKITFDAVYGTDADNLNGTDPESIITFELEDISYRAGNITEVELQGIIDSISVEKTSVNDEYWSWPYNKRVSEEELNSLFEDMEFNDEEKNKIISYLYDKNDEEDYYILKDSPDYNPAQKILNSYKRRIVLKNVFPFYEINDNGEYILADFWAAEKSKDDIFAYYREEVCEEIKSKYPNLNLHDTNDRETYDNLVNSALEKRYEDYKEKNDLLIEKCKLFNIAMVGKVSCTVNYDKEHLYKITRKQNHSEYTMLQLDDETSDDIILLLQPLSLQKTTWNSQTDFSLVDNSVAYSVYEYDVIEQDVETKVKYEGKANITVNNDEFLYGGENNWFYGIWKSSWTEIDDGVVTEDIPFSEKTLRFFASKSDNIKSKSDLNKAKNESNNVNVTDPDRKKSETDINFYLPCPKKDSLQVKDLEKLENKDIDYSVDFDNALIGTVSVNTVLERNETGGKDPVSEYYMPFIYGDIIHADRAGGDSYYSVEGLYKYENNQSGVETQLKNIPVPVIRKTYTEGTDRTPNVNVAFGGPATPIPGNVDGKMKTVASSAQETVSLGGSKGYNVSNSSVKQVFQDINGDGIPDIIQVNDNYDRKTDKQTSAVKATLSSGLQEEKVVYDSQETLSDLSVLGKSISNTDVFGASISPGGNIFITPVGFKRMQQKTGLNASTTPSGGTTISNGTNRQTEGMSDINGDGLCDYYSGGYYKLNKGDGFVQKNEYFNDNGELSKSSNKNVGLNFTLGLGIGSTADLGQSTSLSSGASANLGLSYSFGSSNTEKMMMDINGDGLQDILEMSPGSSSIKVKYNTGSSFVTGSPITVPDWGKSVSSHYDDFVNETDSNGYNFGFVEVLPVVGHTLKDSLGKVTINPFGCEAEKYVNSLDWSTTSTLGFSGSIGVNANIGIDICVPMYVGTLNITVAGGSGVNASTSINGVSVKMMDLDGDGLADHVIRIPGVGMYWKRNISGLYGKLTKVNLPQGGNVEIDYAEQYGTVDNPNFKYVMSKVTVCDGCGITIPEINHGEHSVTTEYKYEDGYYDRKEKEFYGFKTVTTKNADETCQTDTYYMGEYYKKGALKESVQYDSDDFVLGKSETTFRESPYAQPKCEYSWTYEKSSGNSEFIHTETEYNYDEFGNCIEIKQNFGDGEILLGKVIYDNTNTTDYIVGLPVDIRVYDSNGNLLRHRSGDYDDLGQLKELRQYFDAYNYSVHTLKYDSYGNISSVTDSRGATVAYSYDGTENMFVTDIAQSGTDTDTYKGSIKYDIPTQTKKSEEDCSGNTINYDYDAWQRIVEIRTDYDGKEKSKTPAVSYEYNTPNNDSFGHHELWYAITNNKVTFDADDDSIIQTVVQIDGLGRAVRTAKTGFVNGVEGWNASGAVEYDEKGRVIKEGMTEFIKGDIQTLLESVPKMTSLFTAYEYDEKDRQIKTILPDGSAQTNAFYIEENKLISETTDPLGNVSVQETDSRGNIVRVAKKDQEGNLLTKVTYEYNAMGEMLKAFDAKQNPITVEYDLLGRRTALESLDSGRQEFFYDECSNLVRENNSVLRENNKQINYEYDGLNRIVKIDYPDTEDTVYTYGGANAPGHAAGKILKVQDASGTLEYEYGKLGEVTKETRTLRTHLNGYYPTETAVMEYRSDYLGRMQWITYPDGEKVTYGYDRGGQVVSVRGEHYGQEFNYVTNILYDEYGQRTRIDYGNGTFTEYKYDPERRWLDTIKTENKWGQSYQNITYSFDAVGNVLGYENNCLDNVTGNYKTRQTYSYDNLYQLIKVEGETTYNPYRSTVPEFVSNYSQDFVFDELGLGNMTSKVSKESVRPNKKIGDNLNYNFIYVYDENYAHRLVRAGERYYKYDSNGNIICEQDGSFESNGNDTAYHKIEQETEDVYSTDYGWGLFREDKTGSTTSRYRRMYTWNERNQLISSVDANYSTAYVYGQDGQRSNKYTENSETLYFNKMWTHHTDSGNSIYGGQTSKNIYLGETRIVTKLNAGKDPTYQEEYYKQYYYHSDHLGSASLISDYQGDEYQRIEYTPYGETWVEKTSNTGLEYLPYKFTAKELDEETGLYYYGARYLDPRYSMWISTDPALGEYIPMAPTSETARNYNQNLPGLGGVFNSVNLNLYHYAANNPIKYTDPTGRDDTISDLSDEQKEFVSARKTEALEGLKKIKNTLQEYGNDTEGKVVLSESMKNSISDFLGMTDSKEDVQKIIEKLDTLITFIDGLTLENFKYDSDRHRTENEDGTKSQWVAYVSNKSLPIYLCPYFFENKSSKKTSAGTMVHEVTHIEFKTRDITYNEQECKDLSNNRKLKNAQNWRFFYEANK